MSIEDVEQRVEKLTKRLALLEDRSAAASAVSRVAIGLLVSLLQQDPRSIIASLRTMKVVVSADEQSQSDDPDIKLRQLRVEQFIQDDLDLIERMQGWRSES